MDKEPSKRRCLIPDCGKKRKSRGLCGTHAQALNRILKKLQNDEARKALECELVERGLLLEEDSKGRPPKEDNPFRQVAVEMRLIKSSDIANREAAPVVVRNLKDETEIADIAAVIMRRAEENYSGKLTREELVQTVNEVADVLWKEGVRMSPPNKQPQPKPKPRQKTK